MPVVPSYGNDNTSVTPQNLPDVNLQTPYQMMKTAGLAGLEQERTGAKLEGAGSALADLGIQQQIQDNESAAKDAHATIINKANAVLNGTTDAQGKYTPGYLQAHGKDAIDGFSGVKDVLTGLLDEGNNSLGNPRQQEMFKQVAQQTLDSAINTAATHAGNQSSDYAIKSSIDRQSAANQTAILSYNPLPGADNTFYRQQIDTINTELHAQAEAQGLGEKETANHVRHGLGQTFSALTLHLLDNNQTDAAKSFLDAHSDTVPVASQDNLRKAISQGDSVDKVLSYSDKLTATTPALADQLDQVKKDFDNKTITGDERRLIESRVEALAARKQANLDTANSHAVGQAQDFFIKNPGKTVSDLSPSLYRALQDGNYLASMDSFASRNAGGSSAIKTDPGLYHEMLSNMGTGSAMDTNTMKDADFMTLMGKISQGDARGFEDARKNSANKTMATRQDASSVDLKTLTPALNLRLEGIKPSSNDDSQNSYKGAVALQAQDYIRKAQMAAGHQFNQDEVSKAVDKMFMMGVSTPTSFLGIPTGSNDAKLFGMHISDVPSAAKAGIKQSLINSGNKAPSDQDVLLQYWKLHGKH